jgi:glycosyltransferase involved in cell wall biosynthesis
MKPSKYEKKPLVSVLVITEKRPEFMPFVAWVGSSADIESANIIRPLIPDGQLILDSTLDPGLSLGVRRNRAIELARGNWITWADDDDWYPADRLEQIWGIRELYQERDLSIVKLIALRSHVPILSLFNMRCKDRIRKWAWTSCLYDAPMAKEIPFLDLSTAEDGIWIERFMYLGQQAHGDDYVIEAIIPGQILCLHHGRNISVGAQSTDTKYWPLGIPEWLTPEDLDQIKALKERLS